MTVAASRKPLTSTLYNTAGEATDVPFGSLDSDSYVFDAETGAEEELQLEVNGTTEAATLSWNANGTLDELAVSDPYLTHAKTSRAA